MRDSIELIFFKKREHAAFVAQIKLRELEIRMIGDVFEVQLLEFAGVIRVEVVKPDNEVAPFQKRAAQTRTDKPGGAGDQNLHPFNLRNGAVKVEFLIAKCRG